MKSEPDVYGIDDLASQDHPEPWDGIRNYQARNMMRDDFSIGDKAFFYHSNVKVPGIVGIMTVVSEAYADPTQFDPDSNYHDAKSSPENPRWLLVDLSFERKLKRNISLTELKAIEALADMPLVRKGNRLSIMPVTEEQWNFVLSLE